MLWSDSTKHPEIGDVCGRFVALSFGTIEEMADKLQNTCSVWTKQQLPDTAATSGTPNELDLTVLGSDHSMYHKQWDGSNWVPSQTGAFEPLGGAFVGPPVAL